jgi:hypothetical protein
MDSTLWKKILYENKLHEGGDAHHHIDGKDVYADSSFLNSVRGVLPNSELKHMGFGEFYLVTPEGDIQFARGGKEFKGQVGRSHHVYDDAGGKLVKKLVTAMEKKKKSKRVK